MGVLAADLIGVFLRQPGKFFQQLRVMGVDIGGVLRLVVEQDGFLLVKGELHRLPPFWRSNSSRKFTRCPSSSITTTVS